LDKCWVTIPASGHLGEFRIGQYPVTVGQYQRFVDGNGYGHAAYWEAGGFGEFTEPAGWENQPAYPARPVIGVSWYEATAYCAWTGCPTPVGVYPQGMTPEGVHDMGGNVWEWCSDAVEATDRVFRGGSWGVPARYCRSAFRDGVGPGLRHHGQQAVCRFNHLQHEQGRVSSLSLALRVTLPPLFQEN
jgi:formylglycine-generating enzyme required for sulfatase activity